MGDEQEMKMRPFKRLLPREEAMEIIKANLGRIQRSENVSIDEAMKRVLAKDILAVFNVPSFDRASMDGYAVRAEDTYGASLFSSRKLRLVGEQHAGEYFEKKINSGECVQVATGSPIPLGTDAVVMVEFTKMEDDFIEVLNPVYPGANISPAGEDIEEGEVVIKSGEQLTPARIGTIAALGVEFVEVYTKPSVAVISTGLEVKPLNFNLKKGQIYDINSYTLSSVITENGGVPIRYGIISDDSKALQTTLKNSVKHDLIVFSGGSSVGSRDLLLDVVEKNGKVLFHGVQVKPGKPTLFGIVDEKPVFGMPGYPTSCLSNSYLFLMPALRMMARLPPKYSKKVKAHMGDRVVSSSGREQFLTVRIRDGLAYPVFKKSGAITSMANADGYIVLPTNIDTIDKGEEVTVTLLN